jgi:hypothetical protein
LFKVYILANFGLFQVILLEDKIFVVTQRNLTAWRSHSHLSRKKKDYTRCHICGISFREGDTVIRDSSALMHLNCHSSFRYDSPDEPLEAEIDRELIQNQGMLSQRDIEQQKRLLRLRNPISRY